MALPQVPPAPLCVTTGSTGCPGADLPASPPEPLPDAHRWHHWQSQWSFRQSVVKMTVRQKNFNILLPF